MKVPEQKPLVSTSSLNFLHLSTKNLLSVHTKSNTRKAIKLTTKSATNKSWLSSAADYSCLWTTKANRPRPQNDPSQLTSDFSIETPIQTLPMTPCSQQTIKKKPLTSLSANWTKQTTGDAKNQNSVFLVDKPAACQDRSNPEVKHVPDTLP
jgi:hypothetical protein